MGKAKGQKFTLADFTSMVGQKDGGDESWADVEVELPTAPSGASRLPTGPTGGAGEYRPGRGPSDRHAVGPVDLSRIPTTGPFTAYIGNLPYTITESSLRAQLFGGFQVTELRVPIEAGTGRARGFAYATFTSGEEMARAMQALHGKEFGGRPVRLDVSESSGGSGGSGSQKAFGEWRSGARVGAGMEDRPGRRPDPPQYRHGSSTTSHYTQPEPRDWRSATPTSTASSGSSAFGQRRDQDEPSDRPGRRQPGASGPRRPSHDNFVITRDDFGKKL